MNTTFTITSSTSSSSLIILSLFNSRIVPFVSAVIARCSYPCVYAEFFVSVKNFLTGTRPPHFVSCPPRDAQSENINWFHTHCLFARNPTNFSSLKTKNKKKTHSPCRRCCCCWCYFVNSNLTISYLHVAELFFFLVGFPLLKTFYWLNPYHTNFIRSSTIDNIHYFTTKYVREQRHPNSLSSLLLLLLFSPLCIHMGVCVCLCVNSTVPELNSCP